MTRILFGVLAVSSTAAMRTAAAAVCFGEYSTCINGDCALTKADCGSCPSGQYRCPLSLACFSGPSTYSSCPGLAGTHFDASLSIEKRLDYMFSTAWTAAEYISQMTENATAVERLSIPAYSWLNDDQHGVKEPDATAFPNGVALGAAWDAPLLFDVGNAIGVEARGIHNSQTDKSGETGGHQWPGTINNGVGLTLYAPNINLVHDPRWGRAQEVMSECPKLTGDLITSYVQGLRA
jgi:beta-glucosidase